MMDDQVVVQIAECVIDPITRENLQENITKREETERLKRTQRSFVRKANTT